MDPWTILGWLLVALACVMLAPVVILILALVVSTIMAPIEALIDWIQWRRSQR